MELQKKPRGRPSIYTDAIAMEICTRLADGEALRSICSDKHMPNRTTVMVWLMDGKHTGFANQYGRAREAQADHYAEEIVAIANTPMLGRKTKTDAAGAVEITEGDMIEHRRLQVDARKWYASKLAPKKYGDRVELAGEVAIKRSAAEMTDDELAAIAAGGKRAT